VRRPEQCDKLAVERLLRRSQKARHSAMHKFKLRQTVFLQPTSLNRGAAPGAYEVTKQLPERDGQLEYRIKSSNEPHERAVKDNEISSD
jgi:hypothetical protein